MSFVKTQDVVVLLIDIHSEILDYKSITKIMSQEIRSTIRE